MSFITRCPACATAFKVVPDQLKISDGWVRCGHCRQVFDATLHLQPWWPRPIEPAAPPSPPPPPALEPPPGPEPILPPEPDFQPTLVIEPHLEPVPDPHGLPVNVHTERELSFVRQAQRRAFWRRPVIRWMLVILVLLLAALLVLQLMLERRDLIARDYPAARPALEVLCTHLHCTIETPRQLDAVFIDSSVLLRRAPGRYSFNVVIRNRSDRVVAMPAIELTLTDVQDQVLVRRVLPPAEWPRTADVLDAGAQWSVQLDLALEHASDQVMTGYRAILFYP